MFTTSLTLLERLRDRQDVGAWQTLVQLYAPLLRCWLRAPGVQPEDLEDLTQDVLGVLVEKMPDFVHNQRTGAFRTWLKAIAVNKLRDRFRSGRHRPRNVSEEAGSHAGRAGGSRQQPEPGMGPATRSAGLSQKRPWEVVVGGQLRGEQLE